MKNIFSLFSKYLLTCALFISLGCLDVFAQSGIYVGGHFRRERNNTVTDLKASGFTYVILFNISVEPNGDLTTDGQTICSNGTYVFGATNPDYVADVTSLKAGATSINRVESCVGGWGNHSYTNIRNLVNSQGAGTNSILYRNFKALKNAIPAIDAINNDDEEAYDVNSATAFHVMLADAGFKTTLAPYTNKGYWQSLATNVNNQRGGAVDKVYLQWYEGGAGNNPCGWNLNNIEMHTGDLNYANASTVASKMTSARDNCRSKGGFLWVYNDNNINLKELAQRINVIYPPQPGNTSRFATLYQDCNYGGTAVGLGTGDYTLSQLQARGVTNDAISSLKVANGYEAQLFFDDNFSGTSVTINSDLSCFSADWNDNVSSLKVRPSGASKFVEAETYSISSDVFKETTTDTGGGQNVAGIDSNDWLAYYNVNFPSSGSYLFEYRVSSLDTGGRLSADLNANAIQLGAVDVPNTGGWQNWQTVSHTVNVSAGTYNFGIYAAKGRWNINWFRISKAGNRSANPTPAEARSKALDIYPNPVVDQLHLSLELVAAGSQYRILNAHGLSVATGAVERGTLNVETLPSGVYTLVIATADQQQVIRHFVK
ncbi:carbohydrate-binding protein [Hymenobacter terrenus]|uniref:carbohydrate-binding protein n=1 Tax=Hymenobacter terrenus TaxID=1629124 RepID=UPI0006193881|nr:carbohydrate-binding protein [Hymenobacter terrenus]